MCREQTGGCAPTPRRGNVPTGTGSTRGTWRCRPCPSGRPCARAAVGSRGTGRGPADPPVPSRLRFGATCRRGGWIRGNCPGFCAPERPWMTLQMPFRAAFVDGIAADGPCRLPRALHPIPGSTGAPAHLRAGFRRLRPASVERMPASSSTARSSAARQRSALSAWAAPRSAAPCSRKRPDPSFPVGRCRTGPSGQRPGCERPAHSLPTSLPLQRKSLGRQPGLTYPKVPPCRPVQGFFNRTEAHEASAGACGHTTGRTRAARPPRA